LFSRVGGFLKNYPYGYYEDEEFAARLRKYGYKQAVCRSSWVHHEGACTIRSIWRANPNLRKVMEEENRDRCIEDMKKLI
jgi:GT2 family glycosyltransferase